MSHELTDEAILDEIKHHLNENAVMLFMKGSPRAPSCGFSAAVVEIFDSMGVQYGAMDVLADPRIREVLSQHSNWPTIPQVFLRGELIGGGDIVKELAASGGLKAKIEAALAS